MSIIGTKWIFKNKLNEDGKVIKNNTILVVQGYSQIDILDYDETYAPMACLDTFKILLAYMYHKNIIISQIYGKNVFLNGEIKEEVYVSQPLGFISATKS